MTATIRRKQAGGANSGAGTAVDTREHNICALVAKRAGNVLGKGRTESDESLLAQCRRFDEAVVALHLNDLHALTLPMEEVFSALHTLAEQTYENKSVAFGCVIQPEAKVEPGEEFPFPRQYFKSKKFKALSDGFRTAYVVSGNGHIRRLVDLETYAQKQTGGYFPEWTRAMAAASRSGSVGVVLSKQGDILVFDGGSLRFTYRFGKWQYWNHAHLVNLLSDRARAQKLPKKTRSIVVGSLYRASLDVAFRRSGALFVVLHSKKSLRSIVRPGDAIGDSGRGIVENDFDASLVGKTIQGLQRSVVVEISSLDGAVVLNSSGGIEAYGAVLQPKKKGRLRGSEGSRTKAAIGASNYGMAVKISSDGDITVYWSGSEYLRI